MYERLVVALLFAAVAALIVAIYAIASRHKKRIADVLRGFAARSGWHDVRAKSFLVYGVAGSWNGMPVQARYLPRQKSLPERVEVGLGARVPSRIIVRRRFPGFFSNRPISLFGPPIVAMPRQDVWIRADERALVDRLFANGSVAAALLENLVDWRDEIRLDPKGIRVRRSVNGGVSTALFGKGGGIHLRGFDATAVNRELADAWRLTQELAGATTG